MPREFTDQREDLDISAFAGSEHVQHKSVYCRGNQSGGREVVERSIEFALRYAKTVGSGDLKAAYALCDTGLRAAMTFEQFLQAHRDAEREFRFGKWHEHGPALEFHIERFAYVLSDDSEREKSNTSDEGWFKGTAKQNRRSRVIGFWIRNGEKKTGGRGSLWLAEEHGEYRVANFDFTRD